MVKRISILIISLLLILPITIFAEDNYLLVEDNANVFSSSFINDINNKLTQISSEHDIPIYVYTNEDKLSSNTRRNADNLLLDRVGANNNGILLLIDYYNSEVYITTSGKAISILDDDRIESLLDNIYGDLRSNPERSISKFANEVERYIKSGPKAGLRIVQEKSITVFDTIIAGAASLVAYIVSLLSIKTNTKPKFRRYAFPLLSMTAYNFIKNEENLIDVKETFQKINRNTSYGGSGSSAPKSTVHKTGGGTFGGGGKKF